MSLNTDTNQHFRQIRRLFGLVSFRFILLYIIDKNAYRYIQYIVPLIKHNVLQALQIKLFNRGYICIKSRNAISLFQPNPGSKV